MKKSIIETEKQVGILTIDIVNEILSKESMESILDASLFPSIMSQKFKSWDERPMKFKLFKMGRYIGIILAINYQDEKLGLLNPIFKNSHITLLKEDKDGSQPFICFISMYAKKDFTYPLDKITFPDIHQLLDYLNQKIFGFNFNN